MTASPVPYPEQCTLVLQGGGALGAYQAGVYEALHDHGIAPDWVAGVSIGAINAAIIAGNRPELRVARLREFWEGVSSQLLAPALPAHFGIEAREFFNESSAAWASLFGVPGFFNPRVPPAPFQPSGTPGALSYYDTSPLRSTLLRLVDFERINAKHPEGKVRLSVGAVHVTSGNFEYFDSSDAKPVGPQHIMASGALPPGFAPVEIDGAFYWDGGLVSNTPLQYVIDQPAADDMLVFQVDLFSAKGRMPRNLSEVAERGKDIQFASRTRFNTDLIATQQKLSSAAKRLAAKLPPELANDPDLQLLLNAGTSAALTIVHLIHRSKHYETQSKDYEFSRATVREHWEAGRKDVERSLADPRWAERCRSQVGITVLDLTRPEKD
ncbi:NTE family protein [Rhodoferax sp. OV413]|uniref:patatin-like phospholipase family protein n=1 Tax=Rhodoferax sp. OV413 TaxID=1855285 RepID=UPI0008875A2C|nr:patatin-like phospholipase family protein [Rhodoferax sp. OV413]SDP71343.1 NTE family protein [Rhodoferax sp. OV413]